MIDAMSQYRDVARASQASGENRDCAVRALSIVCELPYATAHELLRKEGRRHGCGTPFHMTERAVKAAGWKMRIINPMFFGKTVRTVVRGLSPRKRYLVRVSGHILAVVGGQAADWTAGRCHRVRQVIEVYKEDDQIETTYVAPHITKPVVKPVVKKENSSKLSDDMVRWIRKQIADGVSCRTISMQVSTSYAVVYYIKKGLTYKDVT